MTVNFLLPSVIPSPVGGVKVVLEYANKMVEDGHTVNIIYPTKIKINELQKPSLMTRLSMAKKMITKKIKKQHTATSWFKLNIKVKEILVPSLLEKYIPDADITFATARQTAEWLNTYPASKGKKMYLIQHFEDWLGTKEEVDRTWKMPLYKIVISRWLRDHATLLGEKSCIVNNGLDFQTYNITLPIEQRNHFKLIMLNHHFDWKGTSDGLKAVSLVREKFPQVTLLLFGAYNRPDNLPKWVEYHYKPQNLASLYNEAAIFLSPSWAEGWALPPAEAMQCGCAVVLTDIGGHRDYGVDNMDLLLVPVKNPKKLSIAICKLLNDNDQRITIAKSGNKTIQKFTWDAAYKNLKPHLSTLPV